MPETITLTKEEKEIVKSVRKELKAVIKVLSKGKYNFKETLLKLSAADDTLKELKIVFLDKLSLEKKLTEKKLRQAFHCVSRAETGTWKVFNALSGVGQLTHDGQPKVYIEKLEAIIIELDTLVSPLVAKVKLTKKAFIKEVKKVVTKRAKKAATKNVKKAA